MHATSVWWAIDALGFTFNWSNGASFGGVWRLTDVAVRTRVRALRPGEAAWAALLPCALLTLAAIVVIGPLIGHGLFEPAQGEALWPPNLPSTQGQAEPVKRGRFVAALLGAALLAGAVLVSARRPLRLRPATIRGLVAVGQLSLLALVVAAVLGQSNRLLPLPQPMWPIFGVRAMVVAALLVLALLLALRSGAAAWLLERNPRETRALRIACLLVAAALATAWLLTAITTERAVGDSELMWWTMDDPFAILDGRTPLVDFHAFYAQLTPYVGAAALRAFGGTVLAFSIAMTTLSLLALLAIYAVLRRVVGGRSLLALALFAPFAATGFLAIQTGPHAVEHALGNAILFAIWPMRYGGAYLVAWLAARHLDGAAPRRPWALFLVAGLVALDNLEFGVAAFVATVVALVCARGAWTRDALGRLAAQVGIGALGAVAVVSSITLVRAGTLPHFGLLLEWPRVFGLLGLVALPMPTLGFHLVLFATYVAALVVAVVRRAQSAPNVLLTSMLAWSGAFGLLSASYYLGRSDTFKLLSLFSAWCLALTLLTVVVVQRLAEDPQRVGLADLLVLFGFGLAICSLHELPTPWQQLARLSEGQPAATYQPAASRFVAADTHPGERVSILIPLGHRTAYQLGITNVSPYPFIETIVTRRQMSTLLDATRREGAHKLFLPAAMVGPAIVGYAHLDALAAAGYRPKRSDAEFTEWSDE